MAWPQGTGFSPSLQHSNVGQAISQTPGSISGPDYSSLASISPQQQQHQQQQQQTPQTAGRKRKKSVSNAPSPDGDGQSGSLQVSKHPVKRACNQCRQQKLKCNIITEPEFQPCSRCVKHHLQCAIDPNFRRMEKRQRHAEMERELDQLKAENAELRARGGIVTPASIQQQQHLQQHQQHQASSSSSSSFPAPSPYGAPPAPNPHFPGPNEAAASRSLLDLAQGQDGSLYGNPRQPTIHTLGRTTLTDDEITELMNIYFDHYHPFLPLLPGPDFPYEAYFNLHPLLHWAIITVASRHYAGHPGLMQELKDAFHDFLWYTVSKVPQTYHVVKALCLTCVWPLPTSSTSSDASMIICGSMIQLAMQFGLHRPSHAQDFSRFKIELLEEDIRDRMNTWVVCNLVAQNISTGYGMPQISRWNWFTHGLHLDRISPTLVNRCTIERYIEKVTRALYTMQRDEVGPSDEAQRALTIDTFGREYDELQTSIKASDASQIDMLHVHIAALHLRLTALFGNPAAANYVEDLRKLYLAASTLLHTFVRLPANPSQQPTSTNATKSEGCIYATNYIMQMMLAAGFTLLKLLNSFFNTHIDIPAGRSLFLATVTALRSISVERNDLPQRLAEVLAQLWQTSPQGQTHRHRTNNVGTSGNEGNYGDISGSGIRDRVDDSLQLKVRCRMSMSLLYDSVWRWKDQMGAQAVKNLDRCVINPTIPDSGTGTTSSNNSSAPPGIVPTLIQNQQNQLLQHQQQHHPQQDPPVLAPSAGSELGLPSDGTDLAHNSTGGLGDWPQDINFGSIAPFDSISWALDSFLDMNGINGEGFMGL